MDTGERPAKNIGSSVDSEKNEEIERLPQDAEETNDERIAQSVNAAAASAGSENKTREELFVAEKQVSSGTSAQTRDTEKHTCEALPQSGNAGEEGDVHFGSPADHVKEPDLLKDAGDNFAGTGKIPCDLHPDTKEKSAISERKGEDLEKIKSAPSVDPVVPLTSTEGTHDEASVTSVNPGEASVTCEDSKQKANTKVTLPGEEEILSNTPVQSTDTNEGIEQSGNTGEKGETASPLDGATEASVLPVEKRKTEAGSDFKEKPDLGTKSTVDTEEQKVHSADKGKVHDEKRAQSTSTGGASDDLPLNENIPSEATKVEPDLRTESKQVVKEISSKATVPSASKAESCGEVNATPVDPMATSTDTDGNHTKINETSISPEVAPVSSEESEQKADTSGKLHVEEEPLSNPSAQSADAVEITSAGTEHLGNQGDGITASPVDGETEAPVLPVEEKTETDSDFKAKPDLGTKSTVDTETNNVHSADKGEVHEGIRAQTTSTGGASDDLLVKKELLAEATNKMPSTETDGNNGKVIVTSTKPEEVLGILSGSSEQKADPNGKLPEGQEVPSDPSAQSSDTVEHTSAVTEQLGTQGEEGDISESPVGGAKAAFVSPVEEKKTEVDSDFKEEPDLVTTSSVDTEEQKVHSTEKEEMHDEKRAQSTRTGGASDELPMDEEKPVEATKEDHKTESHLVVEDISSEATVQPASKAESYGEARASTASDGDKPVPSTDPTKGIDKRASLPVYVVKPSENFEDSRDIVQPVHDAGPSPRSTEAMDQPKDEHKDDSNVYLRKRGTPSVSQHIVTESSHPASHEKYKADQMENQSYARTICSVAAGVVVLAAGLYVYLLWQSSPHAMPSSSVLHNYQYAFENLKKHFPGQNEALWLRSEKMHLKHLNKTQPLEPATIILTAARDGERTLRCLSEGLARTYSSALKASYSVIDGSTKAKQESKDAKLEIDLALSSGFSSNDRAAVLHRLEELPPGSVLILYKYCDHENAAFKNVALVFTVVLQVPTMDLDLPLRELEEKVKDVLWDRYLHTDEVNSYDEMDVDKLSGVWSRISHLVLPVVPVESIEFGSCPWQVVES